MPRPAMTEEQRMFYEANGYLVIPNALSPEALTRVRAAADRAEKLWRADTTRPGWRKQSIEQVMAIIEYDDVFLELMEHPKVFPIVREILGNDISMIDNDYFISPPGTGSHAGWHSDSGLSGVYGPRSTMMVKVFWLINDVTPDMGPTAVLPGSHRFPDDFKLPQVSNPGDMPGHKRMAFPAGTAWFFHGRTQHAALDNRSSEYRRVLIFNYGHFYMKVWQGYEPSERLKREAKTSVRRQLLGMGEAYGQALKESDV